MKVLIQQKDTRLFYVGLNMWADDPAVAMTFETKEAAVQFTRVTLRQEVRIILRFGDCQTEIFSELQ